MLEPALILFAKQPTAGQVKTRLQPQYSAAQAADIGACLIRETAALAASNWAGEIYLCGAPSADHPLFHELARRFDLVLTDQGSGDLGARMHAALAQGIARHGAAAVLGCDVPQCPHAVLGDAYALLARGADVLGPTVDGGYYLIGLTAAPATLFTDIAWSGADVLRTTHARAAGAGVQFTLLPALRDIDTADDLREVAETFAPLRKFL